ncbi:homoserine O-acetyltransferase family protein [Ekhidna sp. To15]|uniref:homoserine O-acetyltransferase family protein n=1 Tax=Ekhidna sp. To15 TaxID=3395267 RepID=UPI003F51E051
MPVPTQHKFKSFGFKVEEPLVLECGKTLRDLRIRYTTFGELNKDKSNVVWAFHALTANSDPSDWWNGLIGNGQLINPDDYFIVCANTIGSCYGSTAPMDFNFPQLTIRDLVEAHKKLKDHLNLEQIQIGIGGSMGGQQLLEWAVQEPKLFETIVPIATNAKHSAWGIAFNETQRMAIRSASNPDDGLEVARAIAMLSYRHEKTYNETQSDEDGRIDQFSASSYQRYQGSKLSKRFSPFSYYYLSMAMDSHNLGVSRNGIENALSKVKSNAIVIGIETDILFPIHEQDYISTHLPNSTFHPIKSLYGHDGFLIETDQISEILRNALK